MNQDIELMRGLLLWLAEAEPWEGRKKPGALVESSAPRLTGMGPPGAGRNRPAPVISPAAERKVW